MGVFEGRRGEMSLCGDWEFRGCDPGEGERLGAYAESAPSDAWLPAKVPGVVHLDLMAAGRIPDPFYARNEAEVRWVEEKEWWYRRTFDVPAEMLNQQKVLLRFEGLDTFATIWLNGQEVGRADNMFIPWEFDVRSLLRSETNLLVVRFDSPTQTLDRIAEAEGQLWSAFYAARPYGRKAQYSFGWDWGPRLPTSGIWRPAQLRAYSGGRLLAVAAPVTLGQDAASVEVQAEVEVLEEGAFTLTASLEGAGKSVARTRRRALGEGIHTLQVSLEVDAPALWWPKGYGRQPLYELTLTLNRGKQVCDEQTGRVGLREVELAQEPDEEGKTFVLRVNGVPVFCKGANWIPADSFVPRADQATYERLLSECTEANFNMLRVWGGGIYEDEIFYRLCDEKGILVWQDFMFACAEYPETPEFHAQIRREAEAVVKRLRNHACIALWCGNNENDWGFRTGWFGKKERYFGETIYHRILPEVCERLDPSRPYWPSSPFGGATANDMAEGDRHAWDVWGSGQPIKSYLEDTGRFVSEFGFCAPPLLESVLQFCPPAEMALDSPTIIQHVKFGPNMDRLVDYVRDEIGPCEQFKEFVDAAQVTQALALRTAVEHWRRRKFRTAGCLIWQINDCWPVISWSLVDYYGRRKPAYYYVRRAMAPVLLSLEVRGQTLSVCVVNDSLEPFEGEAELGAALTTGEVLDRMRAAAAVGPNEAREVATVPLRDIGVTAPEQTVVFGALTSATTVVCEQVVGLARFRDLALQCASITPEVWHGQDGSLHLVLNPSAPAFAVALSHTDPAVTFENNYVDLCPGLPNRVRVHAPDGMPRAGLVGGLSAWPLLPLGGV